MDFFHVALQKDLGFGEVLDLSMRPTAVSSVTMQPQIMTHQPPGQYITLSLLIQPYQIYKV